MRVKVTFKDPDALWDCIQEGVSNELEGTIKGLNDEEYQEIIEKRSEEVRSQVGKWFKYGEYLTVEIDTEKDSIAVIEEED